MDGTGFLNRALALLAAQRDSLRGKRAILRGLVQDVEVQHEITNLLPEPLDLARP